MTSNEKQAIESFAWNCTVGSGRDDFDEPDDDALEALARVLARPLTGEDHGFLCDEWRRNHQAMAQS